MKVNYTKEQTEEMINYYLEAEDKVQAVDDLADKYEKPKRSIIGKLAKEGVYIKRVYKTKQGNDPITKKEMIHRLSIAIGADAERLQGLEKTPKLELQYLLEVLKVD